MKKTVKPSILTICQKDQKILQSNAERFLQRFLRSFGDRQNLPPGLIDSYTRYE